MHIWATLLIISPDKLLRMLRKKNIFRWMYSQEKELRPVDVKTVFFFLIEKETNLTLPSFANIFFKITAHAQEY